LIANVSEAVIDHLEASGLERVANKYDPEGLWCLFAELPELTGSKMVWQACQMIVKRVME